MAVALSVSGCSVSDNTQAAEKGVAAFHEAMNAGRHASIYDGSAADMKSALTRDGFIQLLDGLNKKLGPFKTGKTISWNVNATTGGTYVTLTREAQFEKGPGKEEFVFLMDGDRAILAGYHVNSNILVTS
jgi:hypothetical protein